MSSGVFTLGHVGGEAFSELCRVTRPAGVVALTQRLDLADFFEPHVHGLSQHGNWEEIHRSESTQFHPERDETHQVVVGWRVLR